MEFRCETRTKKIPSQSSEGGALPNAADVFVVLLGLWIDVEDVDDFVPRDLQVPNATSHRCRSD